MCAARIVRLTGAAAVCVLGDTGDTVDYVVTGAWSKKAYEEAGEKAAAQQTGYINEAPMPDSQSTEQGQTTLTCCCFSR